MEETPDRTGNSGMSGLKVVFFFPLLPEEDIIRVVVDFFLFKRGGEAGKNGFQPMRKKLGEKFGVVFSFAVVVTDTELLAPLTSMHWVDSVFPFLFPLSIRVARYIAASTANRFSLPPICRWSRRLYFSAMCARRVAMIFSEILPRQLSSEIGL